MFASCQDHLARHRQVTAARGHRHAGALAVVSLVILTTGVTAAATAAAAGGAHIHDLPRRGTQGSAVSLTVGAERAVPCRLSAVRRQAHSRISFRVRPQKPVVNWTIAPTAARGAWRVRLQCGSARRAWRLNVSGRRRANGGLIAPASVRTQAARHDHEMLAASPPGQDPTVWSEAPQGDFGGTGPDFAMPFRCGERWSAATYRNHSFTGNDNPLDFNHANTAFERSAPAVASAAGVIKVSNYDPAGYGHYVVIDHGGGWTTLYAHLAARHRAAGQSVARGDTLGIVGGSPRWAVHLHYEQRLAGRHQPITFHGQAHPYAYWYNGPVFASRNCTAMPAPAPPPAAPAPPLPSAQAPGPPQRFGVQSFNFVGQGNYWAYTWRGWDRFVAQSNTLTYVGVVIGNPNLAAGTLVPYDVRIRVCSAQPDGSGNCPAIADKFPQVRNYGESGSDLGDVAVERGRTYWLLFNAPPPVNGRDWDSFWASTRSGRSPGQRDDIGQTYNLNAVVKGYNR